MQTKCKLVFLVVSWIITIFADEYDNRKYHYDYEKDDNYRKTGDADVDVLHRGEYHGPGP